MEKTIKHSIALAIMRGPKVLVVLRPNDPGDELAGVWGLPAATRRGNETVQDVVSRIAREKLGLNDVRVERLLTQGRQERPAYTLDMELYLASSAASPRLPARPIALSISRSDSGAAVAAPPVTYYLDWQWAYPEVLIPAAKKGSLCTQLFLEEQGRWQRKAS